MGERVGWGRKCDKHTSNDRKLAWYTFDRRSSRSRSRQEYHEVWMLFTLDLLSEQHKGNRCSNSIVLKKADASLLHCQAFTLFCLFRRKNDGNLARLSSFVVFATFVLLREQELLWQGTIKESGLCAILQISQQKFGDGVHGQLDLGPRRMVKIKLKILSQAKLPEICGGTYQKIHQDKDGQILVWNQQRQ